MILDLVLDKKVAAKISTSTWLAATIAAAGVGRRHPLFKPTENTPVDYKSKAYFY